jgi:hypothetical protein
VLDTRLMEMQFGRQPLSVNQLRSCDPMIEEASLYVGRQSSKEGISVVAEQLVKELLMTNVENNSFAPLPSARSLYVVDHLPRVEGVVGHLPSTEDIPPTEDIQSPMLFRSETEQRCGHELLKVYLLCLSALDKTNHLRSKELRCMWRTIRVTIDNRRLKSNLKNQSSRCCGTC